MDYPSVPTSPTMESAGGLRMNAGIKAMAMEHANKLGAGAAKRKKLLHGKEKIPVVMAEWKRGTLHSGSGQIVKNRKQAIAIALSESRK